MASERLLVQIASYNTNLQAERGLPQDLIDWLAPTFQVSRFLAREPRTPDIVAVGFQELLPLHLGLSGLSSKVIESRNALILSQIEKYAPNKEKYALIAKVVNVGVALLVYGLDDGVARKVTDVHTHWTGCGPAYMGNKGAVGVRFSVPADDGGVGEVFTFVCAHLTAHPQKLEQRVRDYHHITRTLLFPPLPGAASSNPTTMYDTSHLFFFGDLNFRVVLPPEHPLAQSPNTSADMAHVLEQESVREDLKEYDQLLLERDRHGRAFISLREGEFWRFKCSYKYKLGEVDKYEQVLKRHPSWTDRIMYATYTDNPDSPTKSHITNALYTSIPSYTTSDHKPVVSVLLLPPSLPQPTLPSPPPTPLGSNASPQDGSPSSAPTPPMLRLPIHFHPRPDTYANLKRYTGRTLDRLVGYCWSLLVFLGAGSSILGIGNFIVGLGVWSWWRTRPSIGLAV